MQCSDIEVKYICDGCGNIVNELGYRCCDEYKVMQGVSASDYM